MQYEVMNAGEHQQVECDTEITRKGLGNHNIVLQQHLGKWIQTAKKQKIHGSKGAWESPF